MNEDINKNIKEYRKNSRDKIGISTASFYPMNLECAFGTICSDLKYKKCEIFVNTASETEEKFLREIKIKADDSGVSIVSVHPYFSGHESFLFFSEYSRRTSDSIKLYRQFFEAAAFWGAKYIIFHGLRKEVKNFPAEKYTEIFLMISDEAKKYGVELLQENVADTYSSSLQFMLDIKQIAEAWDRTINFVLDFKHAFIAGEDILAILDAIGKNILHIHFNDIGTMPNEDISTSKVHSCKLPFHGNLNYDAIFEKLCGINYIGDYITEVYRNNYETYGDIIDSREKFYLFCKG